jgi:hypothetical protein
MIRTGKNEYFIARAPRSCRFAGMHLMEPFFIVRVTFHDMLDFSARRETLSLPFTMSLGITENDGAETDSPR